MKNTILTLASVAALSGAATAQTVFSMQDSTMSASSFTLDKTDFSGGVTSASGSLASVATGGNSGSYLQITNTFTNSANTNNNISNYWLRSGWSYDPSTLTSAEFAKLKFYGSIDRKNDPHLHGTRIFLKQGSSYSNLPYIATNAVDWTSDSGSISPAFSQSGGIIEMGLVSANGNSTAGTASYTAGYDNLSIVATVPEPSSTALLGLGGLALILRRRK